jgi:hypothetical protein
MISLSYNTSLYIKLSYLTSLRIAEIYYEIDKFLIFIQTLLYSIYII